MTNYFHLLYVGHFAYFLSRYGNLYKYSQQGWENINGRFKTKFFHNSGKGGRKGGTSKLREVFYSFLRELLWRAGYMDALFEHLGCDGKLTIDYGKIKKMPVAKKVSDEEVDNFAKRLFNFATMEELLGEIEEEPEGIEELV